MYSDDYKLNFIALCNTFPENSWKSRRYSNGAECFGGGYFIAGIQAEEMLTLIFENDCWDLFKCKEIECAPDPMNNTIK